MAICTRIMTIGAWVKDWYYIATYEAVSPMPTEACSDAC
jgi:hypothetical protein